MQFRSPKGGIILTHAKIPDSEIFRRIALGEKNDRIKRETKVSKERIDKLRIEFPKSFSGYIGDSKSRPCPTCIHAHYNDFDENGTPIGLSNCDAIDCDYQYFKQIIVAKEIRPTDRQQTDRPTDTKLDSSHGIIQDEIGIRYDPDYDLIGQLEQKTKEIKEKEAEILHLKSLIDRPTDHKPTDRPTNKLFDPETRDKFYTWMKAQDISRFSNPMFSQFKKFQKRATFDQVLDLFYIFLERTP